MQCFAFTQVLRLKLGNVAVSDCLYFHKNDIALLECFLTFLHVLLEHRLGQTTHL